MIDSSIIFYAFVMNAIFFFISYLFLQTKAMCYLFPRTQFYLWILSSILIGLCLFSTTMNPEQAHSFSDEFLRSATLLIPPFFFSMNIFFFALSIFKRQLLKH